MAPSPSVFLAAVTQRTTTLRFGPLVYTLNLYHPLRLIDEICMLDQMSGGRLELGVGRGISPYEVWYYGVDAATGPERFAEVLSVVLKGLTEKRLSHAGKYFAFDDVPMEMQPVQRPHPPLWYGANSLESADRLAGQGLNVVVGLNAQGVGAFAARYRAAWAALGRDDARLPLIGLSRHVVVGDTDREAQAAAKRAYALWYDALIHLWRAHGVGLPRQMIPAEFEGALDGGYIVAGSAATVRDRLRRDNAVAGINYCLCRLAFGDLSFEESRRSVELLAREVMPAL
ncbi:MAG: LLM class flavin-dependent oxidoreductase, partial [Rhodospirillales bacterium]|nr:LLM class flavin-dependent oxidoreductase [Rhodospirillales bacterium]